MAGDFMSFILSGRGEKTFCLGALEIHMQGRVNIPKLFF